MRKRGVGHSVVPWIVLLVALAVGGFLRGVGRAFAGHTSAPRYTVSLGGMWLACSVCLIAIFVCQESLEGLFAAGHPAGLEGVFGYGGWWAIPAAVCVGLVLAAWFHGARWALQDIARRRTPTRRARRRVPALVARPQDLVPARLAALVGGWSDRGPPREQASMLTPTRGWLPS